MNRKLKTHMRRSVKGEYVTTMCNMGDIGFWMYYRVVETWKGVPIKDRCKNCQKTIIKLITRKIK